MRAEGLREAGIQILLGDRDPRVTGEPLARAPQHLVREVDDRDGRAGRLLEDARGEGAVAASEIHDPRTGLWERRDERGDERQRLAPARHHLGLDVEIAPYRARGGPAVQLTHR